MKSFKHKLVAVINKELEPGKAMNALAHATLGVGAMADKVNLRLDNYQDSDGNIYPHISDLPFIILRGTNGEIRKTVVAAREKKILHGVFLDTMTIGTFDEQHERTQNSKEVDLKYWCCVLFGEWEDITEMTRKLSIYK